MSEEKIAPAMAGSYDATRALSNATQFILQQEFTSQQEADVIVKQLEDAIKSQAARGKTSCVWTIPAVRQPAFDLQITRRAIRHFLRFNGYWWTQDIGGPNEYAVWWEAKTWRDYLIGNNWDTRYKFIPF